MARRRKRRGGSSALGRAARACKGKRKGAFRACLRAKLRK